MVSEVENIVTRGAGSRVTGHESDAPPVIVLRKSERSSKRRRRHFRWSRRALQRLRGAQVAVRTGSTDRVVDPCPTAWPSQQAASPSGGAPCLCLDDIQGRQRR